MALFFTLAFIFLNLLALFLMYWDKQKSTKKAWRVPESNLLFLCFAGGFIGIFLGMKYFSHKTNHWQFHVAVVISALFWVLALPASYYFLILNP